MELKTVSTENDDTWLVCVCVCVGLLSIYSQSVLYVCGEWDDDDSELWAVYTEWSSVIETETEYELCGLSSAAFNKSKPLRICRTMTVLVSNNKYLNHYVADCTVHYAHGILYHF